VVSHLCVGNWVLENCASIDWVFHEIMNNLIKYMRSHIVQCVPHTGVLASYYQIMKNTSVRPTRGREGGGERERERGRERGGGISLFNINTSISKIGKEERDRRVDRNPP
jgi:hypothetical protein